MKVPFCTGPHCLSALEVTRMRWLEHRDEQGIQELHRCGRLVGSVVVKDYYLTLVAVLDPYCHLEIAQEVSKLLLLGRPTRQVYRVLKTVNYAPIDGNTMTDIVALM